LLNLFFEVSLGTDLFSGFGGEPPLAHFCLERFACFWSKLVDFNT
jgi:hypothetical protein